MDVQIPCICPGERHPDGDTVTLKDRLSFAEAMACKQAMLATGKTDDEPDAAAVRLAAIVRQYLFSGVKQWTLRNGKAIDVTSQNIEKYLLEDFGVANIVSHEAEQLYNPQVLVPLVLRAEMSSRPTLTDVSTSQPTGSTRSPRKRSKRSSTTTTQTDATETTTSSLDGGYSSSRSSA